MEYYQGDLIADVAKKLNRKERTLSIILKLIIKAKRELKSFRDYTIISKLMDCGTYEAIYPEFSKGKAIKKHDKRKKGEMIKPASFETHCKRLRAKLISLTIAIYRGYRAGSTSEDMMGENIALKQNHSDERIVELERTVNQLRLSRSKFALMTPGWTDEVGRLAHP